MYAYGIMSSVCLCACGCQLLSQKLLDLVVLLPGCITDRSTVLLLLRLLS